jgi:peptidoglycan hydrolase CwlO-like protein
VTSIDYIEMIIPLLVALIAAVPGLLAYRSLKKKTEAETKKTDAETKKATAEADSIHAQVADRWAEHVEELMGKVENLERVRDEQGEEIKGLRIDIAQVRRENERYRGELEERDDVIDDLKDWASRLVCQVETYAPKDVKPEKFVRRKKKQ